ncbi:hypothetical protein ABT352_23040 [Streptosporangium sp. NPDC000563]|uniref:hypothetical protein n=1 Tax=Streptosporangium sp. NPDC000563 TaxID=3154366 RepID=UPI00331CD218
MRDQFYRHPLAALRAQFGLSATEYLQKLDTRHRDLGYGSMATRREKAARWEAGTCVPEVTAQLAMADLHGVPREAVQELKWPHWLLLAFPDDHAVLYSPWTSAGTVASMAASQGCSMDRRGFLIATGATLTAVAANWAGALQDVPAASASGRRQLTTAMVTRLEQRLSDLRHLDDVLGGGELRPLAVAEFNLMNKLAADGVYDDRAGRRLFSALAEASRICGWIHFDAGRHAGAQSFYVLALRASASAADPAVGANVLAFMAIQTYSTGNPQDAVNLVRTAQDQASKCSTARVRSMLHARAARALSKTGDLKACAHELDAARDAYVDGPHDDDPPWAYWLTAGEIEMLAGSSALDLGHPRRALEHFAAARHSAYAGEGYVRDNALYLTRAAEAHLALGELDVACATASQALAQSSGVDSARPSGALVDFRKRVSAHSGTAAVRDFLERTA